MHFAVLHHWFLRQKINNGSLPNILHVVSQSKNAVFAGTLSDTKAVINVGCNALRCAVQCMTVHIDIQNIHVNHIIQDT